MFEETIIAVIFGTGVLVIIMVAIAVWQFRMEMHERFESDRETKLSYRTNEEFIGKTGS